MIVDIFGDKKRHLTRNACNMNKRSLGEPGLLLY